MTLQSFINLSTYLIWLRLYSEPFILPSFGHLLLLTLLFRPQELSYWYIRDWYECPPPRGQDVCADEPSPGKWSLSQFQLVAYSRAAAPPPKTWQDSRWGHSTDIYMYPYDWPSRRMTERRVTGLVESGSQVALRGSSSSLNTRVGNGSEMWYCCPKAVWPSDESYLLSLSVVRGSAASPDQPQCYCVSSLSNNIFLPICPLPSSLLMTLSYPKLNLNTNLIKEINVHNMIYSRMKLIHS